MRDQSGPVAFCRPWRMMWGLPLKPNIPFFPWQKPGFEKISEQKSNSRRVRFRQRVPNPHISKISDCDRHLFFNWATGGAFQSKDEAGFSTTKGIFCFSAELRIRTVLRRSRLASTTFSLAISVMPGSPQIWKLDLLGAHEEPGGPWRAILHVLHGGAAHMPEIHPPEIQPKIVFTVLADPRSKWSPFSISKLIHPNPLRRIAVRIPPEPPNRSRKTFRGCPCWRLKRHSQEKADCNARLLP